jgi:hypothetical protein
MNTEEVDCCETLETLFEITRFHISEDGRYSTMMMEAAGSPDTLLATYTASPPRRHLSFYLEDGCSRFLPMYHTTKRQMPDNNNLKNERLGNLKSYKSVNLLIQILGKCN